MGQGILYLLYNQCMIYVVFLRLVFVAIMFSFSTLHAALVDDVLKQGYGVRPLGMGGAFTSVADDEWSLYWNPAGLAGKGFSYVYQDHDQRNTFTSVFETKSVYLGPFAWSNITRTNLNGGSIEVNHYGFGRRSRNGVDWGVGYKNVSDYSTGMLGWTSDLGLLAHILPNVDVGFVAQDILKDRVNTAASARLGLSMFMPERSFIVAAEGEYLSGGQLYPHVGIEWEVAPGLALRGGLFRSKPSMGASMVLPILGDVEYAAISNYQDSGETVHMFGYRIGVAKRRQYRRPITMISQEEVVEIALGGNMIAGKTEVSLLGGSKEGADDLLQLLRAAVDEPSVKGIVIRVESMGQGMGMLALVQEFRQEILRARANGKKVVAFLDGWNTLPEFYLASAADRIVIPELGMISHLGVMLQTYKLAGLQDLLGVRPQIIFHGKHKVALFDSTDISDESKLQLKTVLESLYHIVVDDVRQDRGERLSSQPAQIFGGQFISAKESLKMGLVDRLGFYEVARDEMKSLLNKEPAYLKAEYLKEFELQFDQMGPTTILSAFNRIAIIEIDGPIVDGESGENILFGGKSVGSETIVQQIKQAADDIGVRAVILRVNSPGGSAIASQEVLEALRKLKDRHKPVVVSMGNMAASGGYMVSAEADRIIANPATFTGSIGVVSVFPYQADLLRKLKIDTLTLKEGDSMDATAGTRRFTPEERQLLQSILDETYDKFVEIVSNGRKISKADLADVAQGQIFTGTQALELKLVDELGNFQTAVNVAEALAHIDTGKSQLMYYRTSPGLFSNLGGQAAAWFGNNIRMMLSLEPEIKFSAL